MSFQEYFEILKEVFKLHAVCILSTGITVKVQEQQVKFIQSNLVLVSFLVNLKNFLFSTLSRSLGCSQIFSAKVLYHRVLCQSHVKPRLDSSGTGCRGFLSRKFTIHRTAGEGGGYLFKSSLLLPPASQTFSHYLGDYCRELTSGHT